MQLGMVGLGRMGANMVRRLRRGGHECVVYDRNPESVRQLAGEGATGAASPEEFVRQLMQQNVDPRQAGIDWAQMREAQREPARAAVASALV